MTQSPSEITLRQDMLRKAEQLVANGRNNEYGEPTDNMQRTAEMLAAYFGNRSGRSIEAEDVAAIGVILKLGRLAHNPAHEDSWTDIAGYAAIGYECIKKTSLAAGLGELLKDAVENYSKSLSVHCGSLPASILATPTQATFGSRSSLS